MRCANADNKNISLTRDYTRNPTATGWSIAMPLVPE